jgi:hypothetical protein
MPITQDRLRELLSYDSDTGEFMWRTSTSNRRTVGALAGHKEACGRIQIRLDGRLYRAHRLAWLYVHGRWPAAQIDHINHDQSDNRLSNLREATNQENSRHMRSRNSSGLRGAVWSKQHGMWKAEIRTAKGKRRHLGFFRTKEAAHEAYVAAAIDHHGEFAMVD